jgi:hypothetical protein
MTQILRLTTPTSKEIVILALKIIRTEQYPGIATPSRSGGG